MVSFQLLPGSITDLKASLGPQFHYLLKSPSFPAVKVDKVKNPSFFAGLGARDTTNGWGILPVFLAPEVQDLGRDLPVDGPQAKQETWALLASAKNTVNFAKADWTTEFVNLGGPGDVQRTCC